MSFIIAYRMELNENTESGAGVNVLQHIENQKLLDRFMAEHGLGTMLNGLAASGLRLYRFKKGDFICKGGERIYSIFILAGGRLRVFRTLSNGKSLLLRFCNPPVMVGELEYVTGEAAGSFIEAVTDGYVIAVDYEELRDKKGDDPEFLRFLLYHLARKLGSISNSTSVNQLVPLEQRFANYLVSTTDRGAASSEFQTSNLHHVAELLGTSYRHLNRIIAKLAAEGIVERKRGKVVISDMARLRDRSSEDVYN